MAGGRESRRRRECQGLASPCAWLLPASRGSPAPRACRAALGVSRGPRPRLRAPSAGTAEAAEQPASQAFPAGGSRGCALSQDQQPGDADGPIERHLFPIGYHPAVQVLIVNEPES
ncbi:unnamed protein product [Eretmochelys imbricata]